MDQTSGTIPTAAPAQGATVSPPAEAPAAQQPGFGSRGRIRRRARFLRKARELAYRDLGGLVFNLHRFGERNDSLVLAKLATLGHIDGELRSIEAALTNRSPITVLREAGITACPRCAAIHGSEDRFCPNCGLPLSRHVDLPIAGASAGAPAPAPAPVSAAPAAPPAPAPVAGPPAPVAPAETAAAPAGSSPEPSPAVATPAPAGPQNGGDPSPPASGGRSPSPPARAVPAAPPAAMRSATPEEATEILRPHRPEE